LCACVSGMTKALRPYTWLLQAVVSCGESLMTHHAKARTAWISTTTRRTLPRCLCSNGEASAGTAGCYWRSRIAGRLDRCGEPCPRRAPGPPVGRVRDPAAWPGGFAGNIRALRGHHAIIGTSGSSDEHPLISLVCRSRAAR
jgi:hypothetical protein